MDSLVIPWESYIFIMYKKPVSTIPVMGSTTVLVVGWKEYSLYNIKSKIWSVLLEIIE